MKNVCHVDNPTTINYGCPSSSSDILMETSEENKKPCEHLAQDESDRVAY